MYQTYKDRNVMVITLMTENGSGETPTVEEVQGWANQYNITHPVLIDANWEVTYSYLMAGENWTGSVGLPTETLLGSGMIVDRIDTWVSGSEIEQLLP